MMKQSKAKSGVRAPKSAIAIIIDKLPPTIRTQLFGSPSSNHDHDPHAIRRRAALIAKGDEALRILQVKQAMFMPKNMDKLLVRAALVVEYLARNAASRDGDEQHSGSGNSYSYSYLQTTIPPEVLAKATGFQKSKDLKKLDSMQTVLASYLDGSFVGKKKKKSQKRKSFDYPSSSLQHGATASASASAAMASSSTTSMPMPMPSKPMSTGTNLIHDLCIQLGPMIPDAEFAVSYATKLFEVLTTRSGDSIRMEMKQKSSKSNRTSNSRKRFSMHELRKDVEQYQEYYEAACFYLAVKKSEGDSSYLEEAQMNMKAAAKKDAAAAKSKSERGEDTNVEAVEEEEEYDEDGEHTLQVAHVIRAANLLGTIFDSVLDNVKDWTEGVSISLDPVLKEESKKEYEEASVPKVETMFQLQDHAVGATQNRQTNTPLDTEFELWKFKVLQNARRSVEEKLGEAGKGLSDEEKLAIAADEVLRKAGIL